MKDGEDITENAHDIDIWYFTSSVPFPYTIRNAKEWIKMCKKEGKEKPRKNYTFGIELKESRKIIGSIGLHRIDKINKKAGIGYWLGKKYRKKGIVSEAEKAILDFAFKKLKLNKVYGEAAIENKASNKLFKKFKFRKVGIEKEELIKNNKKLGIKNKKVDAYRWELLRKNWRK
jgi:RimJ/RimL family protein N-acetyltransferase